MHSPSASQRAMLFEGQTSLPGGLAFGFYCAQQVLTHAGCVIEMKLVDIPSARCLTLFLCQNLRSKASSCCSCWFLKPTLEVILHFLHMRSIGKPRPPWHLPVVSVGQPHRATMSSPKITRKPRKSQGTSTNSQPRADRKPCLRVCALCKFDAWAVSAHAAR